MPYDKNKILAGVKKACEKRPVSFDDMEKTVDRVENRLLSSGEREMPSSRIGELVMEELKSLDEVAYVRFASVYREFRDINEFMKEITKLFDKKRKSSMIFGRIIWNTFALCALP